MIAGAAIGVPFTCRPWYICVHRWRGICNCGFPPFPTDALRGTDYCALRTQGVSAGEAAMAVIGQMDDEELETFVKRPEWGQLTFEAIRPELMVLRALHKQIASLDRRFLTEEAKRLF